MKLLASLCACICLASSAAGLTIELNFDYDTFFSTNAAAKAALQQAAQDIGALITTSLPAAASVYTQTTGTATATVTWTGTFQNPTTGVDEELSAFSIPANTVRIFAGMSALNGAALGYGGQVSLGYSAAGNSQAMLNAALQASNIALGRPQGPALFEDSGVRAGILMGVITFDQSALWNFNIGSGPSALQSDFYTVAMHEILHVLGIGSGESWTNLVSGSSWLGTQAKALNGGIGLNLLNPEGDHLREGLISTRLFTGGLQEALMDPSIFLGSRKTMTAMDAALLRDIGWSVIPEPSALASVLLGGMALSSTRWRRTDSRSKR